MARTAMRAVRTRHLAMPVGRDARLTARRSDASAPGRKLSAGTVRVMVPRTRLLAINVRHLSHTDIVVNSATLATGLPQAQAEPGRRRAFNYVRTDLAWPPP